jgi:hypothetical protein
VIVGASLASLAEMFRAGLTAIEQLTPAEQDLLTAMIVADLRARRPVAISPLGTWPPTEPIRDPRTAA